MQEYFMKKSTKKFETAAALLRALETAKSDSRRRWLAIRRKAGRKINPETAEIMWRYGYALDPYGFHPEVWQACRQLQRNYFARCPGSGIWVFFYDLPTATRHALWEKHGAKIAFRLQDITGMELIYDRLESGERLDQVAIDLDIRAAGGALSGSEHKVWRGDLEIRNTRKVGADRNDVIAYLRGLKRNHSAPADETMTQLFFNFESSGNRMTIKASRLWTFSRIADFLLDLILRFGQRTRRREKHNAIQESLRISKAAKRTRNPYMPRVS